MKGVGTVGMRGGVVNDQAWHRGEVEAPLEHRLSKEGQQELPAWLRERRIKTGKRSFYVKGRNPG